MRYRVVFYPMVGQTLAVVSRNYDDDQGSRFTTESYVLKTLGDEPWPLPDMLRELADQMSASEF